MEVTGETPLTSNVGGRFSVSPVSKSKYISWRPSSEGGLGRYKKATAVSRLLSLINSLADLMYSELSHSTRDDEEAFEVSELDEPEAAEASSLALGVHLRIYSKFN